MEKARYIFFALLIAAGVAITILFYQRRPVTRLDSTLAPMYQLFGHATRGLSRALTQVIRVDSLDEKEYGEAIKARCDSYANPDDKDYRYVNGVMSEIKTFAKKPFDYKVYIQESDSPNAFALPGGVIFVTRGLLGTLGSESELVSVCAHEMGHIELSHCLDQVRFELAAGKIGSDSLGKLADFAIAALMRHSFSKTQEDEADEYAYELLENSRYDPAAEGRTFESFIRYGEQYGSIEPTKANVIRDYFSSHPPLAIRAEKFSEKARIWWMKNAGERRYIGKKNLKKRQMKDYNDEWTRG